MSEGDRTIRVSALARVEGETALRVRVSGGRVESVALEIYEPPRFFEALLRGRSYLDPVDVTARICGICPVAYQMSAAMAIEDACGVLVDGPIRQLRRLLYWGEWIESHALHIYLLHAPDFLGYDGAVEAAADHPDLIASGLQLKKAGNAIMEVVGGRAVHPVNPRVGGFHRAPDRSELLALVGPVERAREIALRTVRWAAGLEFPEVGVEHELVSLRHPSEYPLLGGEIVGSDGGRIDVADFRSVFAEEQSEHSTALTSSHGGRRYLVGPMARFALNQDRLDDEVRAEAERVGVAGGTRNPFRSILVRGLEVMQACAESLRIIEAYREPARPHVDVPPRAGTGTGASEAPRGLLYHRYALDGRGRIEQATIVPPTAQNQLAIEEDLRTVLQANLDLPSDRLRSLCERTVRNHDPCISCATHFLRLVFEP